MVASAFVISHNHILVYDVKWVYNYCDDNVGDEFWVDLNSGIFDNVLQPGCVGITTALHLLSAYHD